jgi:hypothetical protein
MQILNINIYKCYNAKECSRHGRNFLIISVKVDEQTIMVQNHNVVHWIYFHDTKNV